MSAAQHTPGPWKVEDPLGPEILSIVAGGPEVYHWKHIAQVSADDEDEGIPPAQVHANARLIAAAPDLLAALEAIQRDLILMLIEVGASFAEASKAPRILQARAAIARATTADSTP